MGNLSRWRCRWPVLGLLAGCSLPLPLVARPSLAFPAALAAAGAPLPAAVGPISSGPAVSAPTPSALTANNTNTTTTTNNTGDLEQRARQAYESGALQQASQLFQQAADAYALSGDSLRQAQALSNLALCLHRLGQPQAARQASAASLQLLHSLAEPASPPASSAVLSPLRSSPSSPGQPITGSATEGQPVSAAANPALIRAFAQATNTQARLLLAQGQTLEALRGWQRAAELNARVGDNVNADACLVNKAQALKQLGFLAEARRLLEPLLARLRGQPPSHLQAAALLTLAGTLQQEGNTEAALALQRDSLASALANGSAEAISAAQLALANSERSLGRNAASLRHYQLAFQAAATPLNRLQAGASQLSLLLDTFQFNAASRLWPQLLNISPSLRVSRNSLDANFHLSQSLLRLLDTGPALPAADRPSPAAIQALLQRSLEQAIALDDRRSQSIALGFLGQLAEQQGALVNASQLTQQALQVALPLETPELTFRWSWQQGRISRRLGDLSQARMAYEQAIAALQLLRQDLVATVPSLQASFRTTIEPLYRQYVDLLTSGTPDAEALKRSRQVIEALQIAELNDFFQQACLQTSPVAIEQIDPRAAVLYPILLPDRLEVIVRLPGANSPLIRHRQPLAAGELQRTVAELERALHRDPIEQRRFDLAAVLPPAQRLYRWLLGPLAPELVSLGVHNLVVVPDPSLRGVPLAVLHDGERFLGQRYGIALAPGLQIRAAQAGRRDQPRLLLAGISEERDNFPALASVNGELQDLRSRMPGTLLLNQNFTRGALQRALSGGDYSVVHLATHGQFSSNAAETFLLAWDQRIPVSEIDTLLRPSRQAGGDAIDLLVLSACETAAGDAGANLGLAAMAVRSGANSTLASLWPVNDQATAQFMAAFYKAWQNGKFSKVDALRQAQQQLISSAAYQHPYYWAAFTLLGNWQ